MRPSIDDPVEYTSVNLDGTTRLLQACRKHGVDRFVFGSSSSVYGNNEKVPFAEDDIVDYPISPYAATKRAGEHFCATYCELFGFRATALRFFSVYGPRGRPDMAIGKFIVRSLRGEAVPLYGDGSVVRDFTYVSDIVAGVRGALDRPPEGPLEHLWIDIAALKVRGIDIRDVVREDLLTLTGEPEHHLQRWSRARV